MSDASWASFEDALKLILTGSVSEPLGPAQRALFTAMLAHGLRDREGNLASETPIEDNLASEMPVEDNRENETPIEDNLENETPIEDNLASETPIEDNLENETPIEDNLESETPLKSNLVKRRRLKGVRTMSHCAGKGAGDPQPRQTMYDIPDLFKYMVTAFQDESTPALPVDLAYLNGLIKETDESSFLKAALREIEIKRKIAELDRTSHGGDPLKLEAQNRLRTQLRAELNTVSQQVKATARTRNMDLQDAANALARQWIKNNQRVFSKREIAQELAKSDEWKDMTAGRIERIIRKKW